MLYIRFIQISHSFLHRCRIKPVNQSFYFATIPSLVNSNNCESKPEWIPVAASKHGTFVQEPPRSSNHYLEDMPLKNYLSKTLPQQVLVEIEPDLIRFGKRVATDIKELGRQCELNPPKLLQQNSWGSRVDSVWTCDAWKNLHNISAEEGIVAIGYEKKYSEWSRLYQVCKLYLFGPSSGLYSCPIAMTDGAAKTIEVLGYNNERLHSAFSKLTTRNVESFWTSGQWMTEKRGGSDVATGTETLALHCREDCYKLYGYKWFTSAVDANMSLTLARIADRNGTVTEGTNGLTLFYVETTQPDGALNNIEIIRLKDKLGTRQVPTAELLLDGTIAYKISEEGRGVAAISQMLTMTRIHNATSAVAAMRCILNLARDYATRRVVFGKQLIYHPLHAQTLARLEVEIRGSFLLLMEIAKWLGKQECGKSSDDENLLFRLLTPVLKLYTAKQAVSVISEGLEAFGGQGYMEDSGLGSALRDAQVLPIWEGTTNVLSLDVLRSLKKHGREILHAYHSNILSRLSTSVSPALEDPKNRIQSALQNLIMFIQQKPDRIQIAARDFAYSLARIYIAALLVENASHSSATKQDTIAAYRWCCCQDLAPIHTCDKISQYDVAAVSDDNELVLDAYEN